MSGIQLSERQFFGLSLGGLLLLIFAIYQFGLRPHLMERADLQRRVEQAAQQLRKSNYDTGEAPLRQRQAFEERIFNGRLEEWQRLRDLLATFENQDEWIDAEVGNIDYKFNLHIVRRRLLRKAQLQNIHVPDLLGLNDEIASNDVARERMLQLRTVEKLVDTAIEFGIADIRSIEPLAPIRHEVGPQKDVFLEEYPMEVVFDGDMERLYRLWSAMFQPNRSLLLRNVAMEKASLAEPNRVRMTATLSALLFVKGPEQMQALTTNRGPARSAGY